MLISPQAHQQGLLVAVLEAGQQQQHLQDLARIEAMGLAQAVDAALPRGGQGLAQAGGPDPLRQGNGLCCKGDGPFLIGGIAPIAAGQDQVFARLGGDHEFLAGGATDRPAVSFHCHGPQAAAGKDAAVGPVHLRIALPQALLIGMEGVGIFHDEFPPPHEPEAGTDFIAELGLNLIEIHR